MNHWIERQRNILDFTLSHLLRNKGKNASVLLLFTLIVFILASVTFFTHSVKEEASILLKEAPELVIQRVIAGRHELMPASSMDRVKQVEGVSSVRGRLWGYYYDPIVGANYTLIVPEDFRYEPGSIAVGHGVSRTRLAFVGDALEFKDHRGTIINLEVKEIFSPKSELVSSDLVLVSEEDFRRLFGISKSHVTDLVLKVKNPEKLATLTRQITDLFPDARLVQREEVLRMYETFFEWRGGIMVVILTGVLLAFAILAWDRASGLSAEEKREIGALKAIGWQTSDVLWMKFWEAATLSFPSFLTGTLLAYVHVFLGSSVLFEPILKGWAVLYPDFRPVPFIHAYQVGALFLLTVFPFTAATILPSWRAVRTDPDSILRT
jgi:ABC-type lipoprotein release transport system permease subunit